MRTTVRLDEELLARAKQFAIRTGATLTAVIEDALRKHLSGPRELRRRVPLKLPTFRGGGLRPGVDLDDTSSLLDHMGSS